MITVDWNTCQIFIRRANTVFVEETETHWLITFSMDGKEIFCPVKKSNEQFDNQMFVSTFLKDEKIFKVQSIGIDYSEDEGVEEDDSLDEEVEDAEEVSLDVLE